MSHFPLILLLLIPSIILAQPELPTDHVHQEYFHDGGNGNRCSDERNEPQRCVPEFVNAAFQRRVVATNTCGVTAPTKYCVQTPRQDMSKPCEICNDRVGELRHPATHLTDFNVIPNETWWQSETMFEGMQHPRSVNLTLNLKKSFSITYVRLKFHSPRPESFAIYKKTKDESDWIPWMYYSASCRATFSLPDRAPILPQSEDVAFCTSEFSDISPISGGDIVFSTLEGRPSAERYDESKVLQDWTTATSIRISLVRMNTFGDERFSDQKVLQSYYYAISDFAVGGRCKCNGHSSECSKSDGGSEERLVCLCKHNTAGVDCEQCLPFYNDRPWAAASLTGANECLPCNCSGLSNRCEFDQELFDETGHGGRCIGCSGNTQGAHCETCVEAHWRPEGQQSCLACNCDPDGSMDTQCDDQGQCPCKDGVGGQQCNTCLAGHYEFSSSGCRDCGCHESGSKDQPAQCDIQEGECSCKPNVEGKQCDRCPPGHYNLDYDNEFGCTKCFCYGHFKSCDVADGYYAGNLTADFTEGKLGWSAESGGRPIQVQMSEDQFIAVSAVDALPVYFLASDTFKGDQRSSYNQDMTFKLRITGTPQGYNDDVVIESADGRKIYTQIFSQDNQQPAYFEQTFTFRLNEDPRFRWTPRMTTHDFMSVLANVSAIKIRGTYNSGDIGYLSMFSLESAGSAGQDKVTIDMDNEVGWVEQCDCLQGHVGQFCESCVDGYKRTQRNGGKFSRCIPCECHGHGDTCDAETGKCVCEHNTGGDTCERCALGYYGNALNGTENDCTQCPCPTDTGCRLHTDGEAWCTNCPEGYTGRFCKMCMTGYFGDPKGAGTDCKPCDCSGNVDTNAVLPCDQMTGACRECIHNTAGSHCERCKDGYWGDAQMEPKGDCELCSCHNSGTRKPSMDYEVLLCAQDDGQCDCLDHVIGHKCDGCETGYFNLTSGNGCESCNCDPIGSSNITCDIRSGQCKCKEGVTGVRCDQCAAGFFGFGPKGCAPCDCDVTGSVNARVCDAKTGQCDCRQNVDGRRCDKCMENMFGLREQGGCRQCDECYTLVQTRVNEHRVKVDELGEILKEILENPQTVDDKDFDNALVDVKKKVKELVDLVESELAGDDDQGLVKKIGDLKKNLKDAEDTLTKLDDILHEAAETADLAEDKLKDWEALHESTQHDLAKAKNLIEVDGKRARDEAEDAASKFGKQSLELSEIAQEARQLSDEQKEKAKEIVDTAKQAKNVSETALQNAKEAIYGVEETSRDINRLNETLNQAETLHNQTKKLAETQQEATAAAIDEATGVLTEVEGLVLPDIDTDSLKEKADELVKEAKIARENAETEATNNRPLVEEAKRAGQEAENALRMAQAAQEQADAIMLDLDTAREKARIAVELANATLTDAQNTLQTLEEFDDVVSTSREKAQAELLKVADIEQKIADAENQTSQAEQALGSAKDDAATAEQIAADAQKQAEDASKDATEVRDRAAQTKASAQNMKKEADELKEDLAKERETLDNYETQADKDEEKAQTAVASASKARVAADRANDTVTEALATVKSVLDKLKSLDDIDDGDLDTLEAELDAAQKALDEAELEKRVKELQDAQTEQQIKLDDYENEIIQLRKDVQNIEEIRDSLPKKCFNVVALEQGA